SLHAAGLLAHLKFASFACNQFGVCGLADVADRAAAIVSKPAARHFAGAALLCGAIGVRRGVEGLVMSGDGTSRLNGARRPGRRRWVAGLLPVVALACAAGAWIILSAWTKAEPPSSQTIGRATPPGTTSKATAQETALAVNPVPGPGSAQAAPV